MKRLYILGLLLLVSYIVFGQTKTQFTSSSISKKEIRYDLNQLEGLKPTPLNYTILHHFKLHQTIQPFSKEETPPFFNLELTEDDIFEYQSGFETEAMQNLGFEKYGVNYLTFEDIYTKTSWVYTTNFDYRNSVNFHRIIPKSYLKLTGIQGIMNSSINPKDEFIRSTLEIKFNELSKRIHFKFTHLNNFYYRAPLSTSNFSWIKAFTFFPASYPEQLNSDWGFSKEINNVFNQGRALFSEVYINTFKNCYLKIELETYQSYFASQPLRQNFTSLGFGINSMKGTTIFFEVTNRRRNLAFLPRSTTKYEEPYFAINAQRLLKDRIFKR